MEEPNGPRRCLSIKWLSAFDMRTLKPNDGNWDFNKASDRKLCYNMISEAKTDFVIGSPPCKSCCVWNHYMNFPKTCPEKVRSLLADGRTHLEFVARICRRQLANGKLFLHDKTTHGTVVGRKSNC